MRKRFAGIDIGSRSIELVVVDDSGKIVTSLQTDTGFDPMTAAKDLIHGGQGKRHFPDGRSGCPGQKRGVPILTTYPIRDTFTKTQMEVNHGQNILNQSSN